MFVGLLFIKLLYTATLTGKLMNAQVEFINQSSAIFASRHTCMTCLYSSITESDIIHSLNIDVCFFLPKIIYYTVLQSSICPFSINLLFIPFKGHAR